MPKVNDRGTLTERLVKRITIGTEEDCWEWQGYRNAKGYGQILKGHKLAYVHRVMYELTRGVQLEPRELVRHTCDNPPCCNPKHLLVGTSKDNVKDMCDRGRKVTVYGEQNGKSKLSVLQVQEIKKLIQKGETERAIAQRFGVCHTTIHAISKGITWRQV